MPTDGVSIALITVFGTGLCGLVGKAIYDRRAAGNAQGDEVPKARNGFVTLGDLEGHCHDKQGSCQRVITAEIKQGFAEIRRGFDKTLSEIKTEFDGRLVRMDSRLDAGDKVFDRMNESIETLVKNRQWDSNPTI